MEKLELLDTESNRLFLRSFRAMHQRKKICSGGSNKRGIPSRVKSMITIRLKGGFGNQLFQYALGRSIELGTGHAVRFDLSWFDEDPRGIYPPRRYHLDSLNTQVQFGQGSDPIVCERSQRFDEDILNCPDHCVLDGHWESEKYFLRVEKQLRDELTLRQPFSEPSQRIADEIQKHENSVFLHVRRSDALSKRARAHHGLLEVETYHRIALESSQARISELKVFVFSDDPTWCKGHPFLREHTVVDCNPMSGTCDENGIITKGTIGTEHEDLALMSLCRHAILANSTFSWWGAWLNQRQDRVVVAPQRFYIKNGLDTTDLMPERWIRI